MLPKNKARIGRIITQLQAVLETDKELSEQEEESVEKALYHLKGLVDGIIYVTNTSFDEDDLRT